MDVHFLAKKMLFLIFLLIDFPYTEIWCTFVRAMGVPITVD